MYVVHYVVYQWEYLFSFSFVRILDLAIFHDLAYPHGKWFSKLLSNHYLWISVVCLVLDYLLPNSTIKFNKHCLFCDVNHHSPNPIPHLHLHNIKKTMLELLRLLIYWVWYKNTYKQNARTNNRLIRRQELSNDFRDFMNGSDCSSCILISSASKSSFRLFIFATFCKIVIASFVLPFASSHLGDSVIKL